MTQPKYAPETLRRAAEAARAEYQRYEALTDSRWQTIAQAALDAVFSSDVSEDEREHCERLAHDLVDQGAAPEHWEYACGTFLRERAQADAAGYARGLADGRREAGDEWSARWVGATKLTAKAEDELTALQAKYDELRAAAEKLRFAQRSYMHVRTEDGPEREFRGQAVADRARSLDEVLAKHGSKNDELE